MAQDLGLGGDGGRNYKVYFLTDRRLYELAYSWLNMHDEAGQAQPREQWVPQFTGELRELSLRGADVMQMVQDGKANIASVVSVAPATFHNDTDEATRVTVSDGELPASLVFILPSASTSDTFRRTNGTQEQPTGGIAHALSSTTSVNEQQHYDVVEVNRIWGTAIEASTDLTLKQAMNQTQTFDGALIFRYYGETNVPQGKKRDTLEWLNPQYVPWQETLGFYFRGLFFETSNVIEVPGEQGDEQVPAEIYLATAFQVQRDGPRNISIYRPFGKHEEAIAWLRSTAHVKASVTRLVPDPASTNWFVLSDMQNLNPLGFRPQGEVEWIN
jgi:hypothetical protein